METKKIGILGGSFNPIHNGHVNIIEQVINTKAADEVWLAPTHTHDFGKDLLDFNKRVNMLEKLFKNNAQVKIIKIEEKLPKPNLSFNTIKALQKNHPEHKFYFIIGSDCVENFHKWIKGPELAKITEFIIYKREGYQAENSILRIVQTIEINSNNISSTIVREKIAKLEPVNDIIPKVIEQIIWENRHYGI
ncbi:MAG: nicotinate-nucleotide adenylyltransferase [Patescibacteria group bacterium]|jgi:nicotinate-nucleotide adenylyltransferase